MSDFRCIKTERRTNIGIVTFDRPQAMNALNEVVAREVTEALMEFDADDSVGCMIVAGGDKAFCAGAGGPARLTRAIGKAKAMYYILTGATISAAEAERIGMITRAVDDGKHLDEAIQIAIAIANNPRLAVLAGKEAVNQQDLRPAEPQARIPTAPPRRQHRRQDERYLLSHERQRH